MPPPGLNMASERSHVVSHGYLHGAHSFTSIKLIRQPADARYAAVRGRRVFDARAAAERLAEIKHLSVAEIKHLSTGELRRLHPTELLAA